jgi:hypothetical protein
MYIVPRLYRLLRFIQVRNNKLYRTYITFTAAGIYIIYIYTAPFSTNNAVLRHKRLSKAWEKKERHSRRELVFVKRNVLSICGNEPSRVIDVTGI